MRIEMDMVIPCLEAPILDTFLIKELTPCVVYTYYNKNKEPLYTGKSIDFYDRHYWHMVRDEYSDEIEYVGLRFYDSPAEMEIAELFWIQKLKPQYNRASKHDACFSSLSVSDCSDELVVYEWDLIEYWRTNFLYESFEKCGMDFKKSLRKRNF